ncbi:hypothetical protein MRB53_036247 [Persea americana]|nr:hypothetical protein MRB53_036247 [Persea americana]
MIQFLGLSFLVSPGHLNQLSEPKEGGPMTGSNEGTTEEAKPLKQLHFFPSPAKLHLIRLHVRLSQREGANQLTEANSIHSNPVSPEPDPTSEGLIIQLLASHPYLAMGAQKQNQEKNLPPQAKGSIRTHGCQDSSPSLFLSPLTGR